MNSVLLKVNYFMVISFQLNYSALSLQQGMCNEILICNEKSIFDQAFLENVMQNATIKFVIL